MVVALLYGSLSPRIMHYVVYVGGLSFALCCCACSRRGSRW